MAMTLDELAAQIGEDINLDDLTTLKTDLTAMAEAARMDPDGIMLDEARELATGWYWLKIMQDYQLRTN